jgi:hypothetical protein
LGVGYCREGGLLGEKCFEGLSRGVRGDALACRGHPYMFKLANEKILMVKCGLMVSYM